ncbi:MAG: hypothetical protein AB7F40_07300 [Victivallaceae bacterium]|nr:hypothetical protein [Victivallaceae bacterium]
MMFQSTRWAKEITALQQPDGLWGNFHALSVPLKGSYTTEQALRRLEILGFTIGHDCVARAVSYMHDCLIGKKTMPDCREVTHDWDIFTDLMLATWIRRFTDDDDAANNVADRWAGIISGAFSGGGYSHKSYLAAYEKEFNQPARGGRLIDPVNFYVVSLVADVMDIHAEHSWFEHIINHEQGIYYFGYKDKLSVLPASFKDRQTVKFIRSAMLLSEYRNQRKQLAFVADWLISNRHNGEWDLGSVAKDGILFPLSDSWKNEQTRTADCTCVLTGLLTAITAFQQ